MCGSGGIAASDHVALFFEKLWRQVGSGRNTNGNPSAGRKFCNPVRLPWVQWSKLNGGGVW